MLIDVQHNGQALTGILTRLLSNIPSQQAVCAGQHNPSVSPAYPDSPPSRAPISISGKSDRQRTPDEARLDWEAIRGTRMICCDCSPPDNRDWPGGSSYHQKTRSPTNTGASLETASVNGPAGAHLPAASHCPHGSSRT